MKKTIIPACSVIIICCASFWFIRLLNEENIEPNTSLLFREGGPKNEYLSCQQCHQKEVGLWKQSHHKKAMDVANEKTVLGNFDNQSFTNKKGEVTRFFKKKKKFFINTIGDDGKKHDFQVKFVFGFEPLQQYLFQLNDGKIQTLSIAWDNHKKKWYTLYPDLDIIHKDRLHWTSQGQNWNSMCASCHTTNFEKNFDVKTQTYHSKFDEINVSCSSCHGSAEQHMKLVKEGKLDDLPKHKRHLHKYGFQKSLARTPTNSLTEIESCAPCHSRRVELKKDLNTDEKFSDKYLLSLLERNIYQMDGQLLDETYVLGSFAQSKMYHKGIRCSDCHDSHSSKLVAQDNNLCIRCHQPQKYNSQEHTHHKVDSKGSLCVSCHMPGKHYMGIDFRRDHSFRVPRPDLSVKYQTPNACNNCHTDKSSQWAADAVVKWFGKTRQQNFVDLLLPARQNEDWSLYIKLLNSTEHPEIVRATVALELNNFLNVKQVVETLSKTISDEQILVREASIRAFQSAPADFKMRYIFPLISDASRPVRFSAYRVLIGVEGINKKSLAEINKYVKVGQEYKEMLEQNADFPSGQFQYALYYTAIKDLVQAEKSYLKAIEIDRYFSAARFNLATLYRQQNRFEEAKKQYEQIIKLFPQDTQAYFQLGLMYYSQKEYVKAVETLKLIQKITPNDHYIFYALGEIYVRLGRLKEAENQYLQSLKLSAKNYTYLISLAKLYLGQKDLPKLDKTLIELISIAPKEPEVFQLRFEYKKLKLKEKEKY